LHFSNVLERPWDVDGGRFSFSGLVVRGGGRHRVTFGPHGADVAPEGESVRLAALLTSRAAPAPGPHPAGAGRPGVRAVVRHLALSLLVGTIVPSALFYICLVAVNVWTALIMALVWSYGALAWRVRTRRRTSVLLWLTVVGLTGKTIVTMATGSTFIYFVQPALTDALIATAFLVSLVTATPVVARLAAEFYPMTSDVAGRPRVQRLFWRLTLLWAVICAAKAASTLWLLHSLSLTAFVAAKSVITPGTAAVGAVVSVLLAVRVARREGLLPAAGRPAL